MERHVDWSALRRQLEQNARLRLRRQFTKEEWEKKLNDVPIRTEDMNKLVMNFLVTECYVEAAESFLKKSGTEHIDFATVRGRMAIKKAVQCGNVDDAIKKVKELNPEILDICPKLKFRLIQQKFIELIRNGKGEEALDLGQEELGPLAEKNQDILEELERTAVLLAFEDVSNCPSLIGELLDISQRLRTASEVDAAILTSQTHEKDPKLTRLIKILTWALKVLEERPEYHQIDDLLSLVPTS